MVVGPKHLGGLDLFPFQGFARRSGKQVFRLYSKVQKVFKIITSNGSQWRPMMGRVSPSHPYNAGRAGLGWGVEGLFGLEGMSTLHAVVVLWGCLW